MADAYKCFRATVSASNTEGTERGEGCWWILLAEMVQRLGKFEEQIFALSIPLLCKRLLNAISIKTHSRPVSSPKVFSSDPSFRKSFPSSPPNHWPPSSSHREIAADSKSR